jgi:hypothetical protein
MEKQNNTFWVVWCSRNETLSKRHESQESAVTEAKRLAAENPKRHFYVLRAESLHVGEVAVTSNALVETTQKGGE